jgi:regulator of nonsense transcripts 2
MYYFAKVNPAPKDIEYTIIESLEALGSTTSSTNRYALADGYQGALSKLAELGKKDIALVPVSLDDEIEAREMVQGIVESSDEEDAIEAAVPAEEEELEEGEESDSEEEDEDTEPLEEEDDEDFDEDAQEEANEAERQFEQEFSRMMKDSLDSRKHAANTGTFDLPVPKTKATGEAGEGLVSFTMLSRGKQQVGTIYFNTLRQLNCHLTVYLLRIR